VRTSCTRHLYHADPERLSIARLAARWYGARVRPDDAIWNEADREWELGETRGGRKIGAWRWWREDGTLACESSFDDDGELHGVARRFHPNGEVSLIAPYVNGKLHGKQIATRPSEGDSPEMRELLTFEDVYRLETLYVEGVVQKGMTTLYGREGLFDPIACDAEGLPTAPLGTSLDKLRAGTALEMTRPFLYGMVARTPRSMIVELHYICAAIVGGASHRLRVVDRRGQEWIEIVHRAQFEEGGFALAVDRAIARAGQEATPGQPT
jgi:hypothetical protein